LCIPSVSGIPKWEVGIEMKKPTWRRHVDNCAEI
jgi:hypothetical protein